MKIETKSLSKTHGENETTVITLLPCSFEIGDGERVAIIGASRSGKSTLLHLLGAFVMPSGETVLFDGKRLPMQKDEALFLFHLKHIGFVF